MRTGTTVGSLGDAMKRAGIDPLDSRLRITLQKTLEDYSKMGGTTERWLKIAYEVADETRDEDPQPSSSPGDGEANVVVPKGQVAIAEPSPPPPPHRPRREPNPARSLDDIVAARSKLWKHYRTGDGKYWANVKYFELFSMDRDGGIARLLRERLGTIPPEDHGKPLHQLINGHDFQEVFDAARTRN